ncbi:MAG: hypothetical protein ACRD5K_11620 [Candidatus Acidiferrales bacterium]
MLKTALGPRFDSPAHAKVVSNLSLRKDGHHNSAAPVRPANHSGEPNGEAAMQPALMIETNRNKSLITNHHSRIVAHL